MDVSTNYLMSAKTQFTPGGQVYLDVKITFPKQMWHTPASIEESFSPKPIEGYRQYPPMEFTTVCDDRPSMGLMTPDLVKGIHQIWAQFTSRLDGLGYTGKLPKQETFVKAMKAALDECGFPVGVMADGRVVRLTNYEGHNDPYDYLEHWMQQDNIIPV